MSTSFLLVTGKALCSCPRSIALSPMYESSLYKRKGIFLRVYWRCRGYDLVIDKFTVRFVLWKQKYMAFAATSYYHKYFLCLGIFMQVCFFLLRIKRKQQLSLLHSWGLKILKKETLSTSDMLTHWCLLAWFAKLKMLGTCFLQIFQWSAFLAHNIYFQTVCLGVVGNNIK